ncbi:optineurin-like [Malaya genurostris]|uniref:optineurin-like n=1 Tax=Malaya genurostris TaxID=325434 RepID=UPI0026F3FAD8|nr:optineurin-like [Malaya genurostris]
MSIETIKSKMILEEKICDLEEKNSLFVAQIAEYEKMRTSCSDNLDSIKTNLETLQELLAKCRSQLFNQPHHTSRQTFSTSFLLEDESSKERLFEVNSSLKSEVEVLRAQVEIFKKDFTDERTAREALLLEKNRLARELSKLQQQNRELIACSKAGLVEHQESSSSAQTDNKSSNQVSWEVKNRNDRQLERSSSHCSLCNKYFGDIQSLETHIDECPAY